MEIFDPDQKKISRARLSQNRTFHIQISLANSQCLASEVVIQDDSWL